MRDYGKVGPAFWTRGTGRELRGNQTAQLVCLYLVTCPSANMIGLYYLPKSTIAHDLGSPLEGASKALRRVCDVGFCAYDDVEELVFVPNMASFQVGPELKKKDLRRAGVLRELHGFRKHPFALAFFEKYAGPYCLEKPDWLKPLASPSEAPCKPLRSQDQDQEQEQEQEQEQTKDKPVPETPAPLELVSDEPKADAAADIFAAYLDARVKYHPKGSVPLLTPERRKLVARWLKAGYSAETLAAAARGIWASPFHRGENDRGTEYSSFEQALKSAANIEKFSAPSADPEPDGLTTADMLAMSKAFGGRTSFTGDEMATYFAQKRAK